VPVPTSREQATTERQLAGWLAALGPERSDVAVRLRDSPAGSGFSSETLLFDAEWSDPLGHRCTGQYAARLRPTDYTLYQEHDLDTQWRVIDGLHRHTEVPVPAIVGADTSAGSPLGVPFFVMERVEGQVPADNPAYTVRGWLADAPPACQAALYQRALAVLAAIHAVDWPAVGLGFLAGSTANPVGTAAAMDHDEQFLGWVADRRPLPLFEACAGWLRAHLPPDPAAGPVLNWGDARLGNMLFRDHRPVAVLDWEMVTLGAREADLGWWLLFNRLHTEGINRPQLPGFPDEDGTVACYERLSGHAIDRDALHFYLVRAAFRGGLLLVRYTDMLVANGLLAPDATRGPHTPAVRVLNGLLGLALEL
jgi:aminoglycoside phosphotransferase (APT) family kinase protein